MASLHGSASSFTFDFGGARLTKLREMSGYLSVGIEGIGILVDVTVEKTEVMTLADLSKSPGTVVTFRICRKIQESQFVFRKLYF